MMTKQLKTAFSLPSGEIRPWVKACACFGLFMAGSFGQSAWAQTTIWAEDFSAYADQTTVGTGSRWTITSTSDVNGSDPNDHFWVVNNKLEARDTNDNVQQFDSEAISISGYTGISFSMVLTESGTMESSDDIEVLYRVDGGSYVQAAYQNDDFTSFNVSQNVANGSTLEIRILVQNGAASEYHFIDDIEVSGTATSSVDDPTSFTATDSAVDQLDLSWTDNASGDAVMVLFDTDNTFTTPSDGTSYSVGNTSLGGEVLHNSTVDSFSHTSLTPGQTYYYQAYSVDGSDNYSPGVSDSDTTPCFGTPTATAASSIIETNFTANWNSVTGVDGYVLDVSEESDFETSGGNASDLFISEYIDGDSGSNDGIEIFNGTGSSVNLADYRIWRISNGGSWPEAEISLSGTLAHNDVFVVINISASFSNLTSVDDLSTGTLGINGDDAVGLAKFNGSTWDLIDAVGEDGSDPGSGWAVAGIANATADRVLTRKSSVSGPNTDWDDSRGTSTADSEWIVAPGGGNSDAAGFGSHTFSGGSSPSFIPGFDGREVGNVTSFSVTGLTEQTTYYYRVRATNEFCTSDNSSTTTVTTTSAIAAEPTTQATGVSFASVTDTSMNVSWTDGNGSDRIVVMKANSAVSGNPSDQSSYSANSTFGSGDALGGGYVVYNGSGSSVSVSGLSAGTTYHVRVYEFNGSGGTENYLTSTATDNPDSETTLAQGPPSLSSPTVSAVDTTSATLGATVDNDGNVAISDYGIVWDTSTGPVTSDNKVQEGTSTTPPTTFTLSAGSLPAGDEIFYRGYAVNAQGTAYSPEDSFFTEPATQPSGLNFTSVGTTGFTVNWTVGSGDGVIVVLRESAAVSGDPSDGTTYTADADFTGSGTSLGGGKVVYTGSGNNVSVTGLSGATTYHVALYEYAGSASEINYQQDAPLTGSQATTANPPTVTTGTATPGTPTDPTQAEADGNVTDDGGASVTERGIVWNTAGSPDVNDNKVTSGTGPGSFTATLTGLTPGDTIHFNAYAINSEGTSYGTADSFTADCFTNAPTGLYANPTNETDFTANWTAVPGAVEYQLDVSTNNSFASGGSDSDDFTDGNFSANPVWTGATGSFSIQTASTLPGGNASTDSSYLGSDASTGDIALVMPTSETSEWRFSLGSPDFNPSGANFFGVILMSDTALSGDITAASWNGYYLRLGENGSGDQIDLVRRSGSSSTAIGTFGTDVFATGALDDGLDIRITRNGSGQFEMFTGNGFQYSTTPTTSEGTLTDNTHTSSSYFGVYQVFANPSTDRRVYMDNIELGTGGGSPDYLVGYSNRTVAATSQIVTGLVSGTEYFYRVRAVGAGSCVSDNSSTQSVTTTTTPVPEISILGTNGVEIADGETVTALSEGTDFGSVDYNSGSQVHTFTVTNSGTATLNITGVTTSGTHAVDFEVTSAPASTVAAGGTTTFDVTFDPSDCGVRSATLTLTSDDSDEAAYDFAVEGEGSIDLNEALDNSALTFTTSGDEDWFGQCDTFNNDGDAAQSGGITDNQATYLETTVTGPGTLSFDYKVDSESSYDFFYVVVAGVTNITESGDSGWISTNISISAGSQTLQWKYEKDGSVSTNSDAAWVDNVSFSVPADEAGPLFSNFGLNTAGNTSIDDAAFSGSFDLLVDISDSTSGVDWTVSPPVYSITNPSGTQAVAPTAFNSAGHVDGEQSGTATGAVSGLTFEEGAWTVNVVAEDLGGYGSTNEFTFTLVDDDPDAPEHSLFTIDGIGGEGDTNLLPGAIAIVAVNGSSTNDTGDKATTESFISFVVLSPFPSNTVIEFTDTGWDPDTTNWFRPTEIHTNTFTASGPGDVGTVFTLPLEAINNGGDQIAAYQYSGTGQPVNDPTNVTFIFAINLDTGTNGWDTAPIPDTNEHSGLYKGLTNNVTAVSLPFNGDVNVLYTGLLTGTASDLLAAITDENNWESYPNSMTLSTTSLLFNVTGAGDIEWSTASLTDAELNAGGYAVSNRVQDTGSGLAASPPPYFMVRNNSGDVIVSNAFAISYSAGDTSLIDLDLTAGTGTYSAITLGTLTSTVTAVDNDNDRANDAADGTVELRINISDDDSDVPSLVGLTSPDLVAISESQLQPGDLAILGFNGDGDDDFSFMTFVDIAGGTTVNFTDNEVASGVLNTGEGVVEWTAPGSGLPAGSVVVITDPGGTPGVSVGKGTAVENGAYNFAGSGDQLIAYQVSGSTTGFIFAVDSSGTDWSPAGSSDSDVPPGLTAGVNALHMNDDLGLGADDNYEFTNLLSGTIAQLKSDIQDGANWNTSDGSGDQSFTLSEADATLTDASELLALTDGDLAAGGWTVTGQVSDATSGLDDSSMLLDLFAPSGAQPAGFASVNYTNILSGGELNVDIGWTVSALAAGDIELGVHTGEVVTTDFDDDRPSDALSVTNTFIFTVEDDDIQGPLTTNLLLNGESATLFDTGFELYEGWTTHGGTNWTENQPEGDWISTDVFVVSFGGRGGIGNYAGFNDVGDTLQLPPVDEPGYLSFFARLDSAPGSGGSTLVVEKDDGGWTSVDSITVYSAAFEHFVIPILDTGSAVDLRFRLTVDDRSVHIDDLALTPYPAWTNWTSLDLSWDESNDADTGGSGLSGYEYTAINAAAPDAAGDGTATTATNISLDITGTEGVLTGFVFAVDNDDDRGPVDQAKGRDVPYLLRIDQTEPPKIANFNAVEGEDPISEIDFTWTAATDAGGANLSPWQSYRIYYSVDGNNPTLSDPFFDVDTGNPNLGTIGTSASTISNFTYGNSYKLAVAGRDEAGNVGDLSDNVITISLDSFNVTQGVAEVRSIVTNGIHLSWTATTNASGDVNRPYDVLYWDSTEFTESSSNQWDLLATVTNRTLDDVGQGSGINPTSLVSQMRFYRASLKDRWRTNQASRIASEEVYVLRNVQLMEGQNWVAFPGVPDETTAEFVFGKNLPAAPTIADAAKISWFDRDGSPDATNTIFLQSSSTPSPGSTNWLYSVGGSGMADDVVVPVEIGVVVEIPEGSGDHDIQFIGLVPTNTVVQDLPGNRSYSLISPNQPAYLHPSELNLLESGFSGGSHPIFSDRIWKFDRETQQVPNIIWYDTGDSTWRFTSSGYPTVPDNYFGPDDAIVVYTRSSGSTITHTNSILYSLPTKEMTP